VVNVEGKTILAHRWVLSLRGQWTTGDISTVKELSLPNISYKTALIIFKYLYTDILEDSQGISYLLEILQAAHTISLAPLKLR
jgi:hypothetical protein